jgi:hypothetical protein
VPAFYEVKQRREAAKQSSFPAKAVKRQSNDIRYAALAMSAQQVGYEAHSVSRIVEPEVGLRVELCLVHADETATAKATHRGQATQFAVHRNHFDSMLSRDSEALRQHMF